MRVAFFVDTYRAGGAERYYVELANALARRGVDVHTLTSRNPALPYLQEHLAGRITLHVLSPRVHFDAGFLRNVIRVMPPLAELRRALRRLRPDLLHINNGGYPGSHLCRAAVFAAGGPRIMTVNSRAQPRIGMRGRAYRMLDPILWRRLDRVICPSAAAGQALSELRDLPEHKLRVIHYGISPPAAATKEAQRIRQEAGADSRLLVGMVVAPDASPEAAHKGHGVLVEAVGSSSRDDVVVVFVGHDPGPVVRGRAKALGLSERMHIHAGFRHIAPYMAAFDVLVVPSTAHEGLPLVILDALATGTPVLGSRLSGIPEAVLDGVSGRTFPPGDSSALAAAIDRLASDRAELQALSGGARRLFAERFSSDRMVEGTLAVYDELLGGAP
jgi:glycosyltransferase involved in cell wall biosynthesis